MDTQLRFSVSGASKTQIRQAVGQLLVSKGFTRTGNWDFSRSGQITPEEARIIIDDAYDIEARHFPSRIVTLHMLSELIVMIVRRHRNRSA